MSVREIITLNFSLDNPDNLRCSEASLEEKAELFLSIVTNDTVHVDQFDIFSTQDYYEQIIMDF